MYFIHLFFVTLLLLLLYGINYIYRFYSKLKHYPRGPIPLPVFGNCLMLIFNLNRHPAYFFKTLAHKYGDIYTFWVCSTPLVIISGIDVAKQAFMRNECSDRMSHSVQNAFDSILTVNAKTFPLMNFNDEFKTLRKVSNDAIRKFLSGNKLHEITHGFVDETVELMLKNQFGNPFVPIHYIDSLFIRILTKVTFGVKLGFKAPEIQRILHSFKTMQRLSFQIIICEFIPALKIIFDFSKQKPINDNVTDMMKNLFHKLDKSEIRLESKSNSFSESYILAANNNRTENIENVQYLNDKYTVGSLYSLFIGANETSHCTFIWMLLLMAYYPEIQRRMRDEISHHIGNKTPEILDLEKCDFVNAFICETLRFRVALPFGFMHATSSDINIVNSSLPKGTTILLNHFSILNDNRYWENPEIFNPNRFLDSDQRFAARKCKAFIPFGIGKRMCIGDKFAMNMLFLVLTRFLQATHGCHIELPNECQIDFEPQKSGFIIEPNPYSLLLIKD